MSSMSFLVPKAFINAHGGEGCLEALLRKRSYEKEIVFPNGAWQLRTSDLGCSQILFEEPAKRDLKSSETFWVHALSCFPPEQHCLVLSQRDYRKIFRGRFQIFPHQFSPNPVDERLCEIPFILGFRKCPDGAVQAELQEVLANTVGAYGRIEPELIRRAPEIWGGQVRIAGSCLWTTLNLSGLKQSFVNWLIIALLDHFVHKGKATGLEEMRFTAPEEELVRLMRGESGSSAVPSKPQANVPALIHRLLAPVQGGHSVMEQLLRSYPGLLAKSDALAIVSLIAGGEEQIAFEVFCDELYRQNGACTEGEYREIEETARLLDIRSERWMRRRPASML